MEKNKKENLKKKKSPPLPQQAPKLSVENAWGKWEVPKQELIVLMRELNHFLNVSF